MLTIQDWLDAGYKRYDNHAYESADFPCRNALMIQRVRSTTLTFGCTSIQSMSTTVATLPCHLSAFNLKYNFSEKAR